MLFRDSPCPERNLAQWFYWPTSARMDGICGCSQQWALCTCAYTHTHTHTHTHVIWGKSTAVSGSGVLCDHYHPQTPNCFSFFKPKVLIFPHLHMSSTEQSIGQVLTESGFCTYSADSAENTEEEDTLSTHEGQNIIERQAICTRNN